MNETADRVRIVDVKVLSDDWYVLKKVTFDYRRADGSWQRLSREAYDRGNGATCCSTSRCAARWCSRASSGCPRSSTATTGC